MNDLVLEELKEVFGKFNDIEKAVLFGSRARGDNTERSDYDVALYGNINSHDKSKLRYICSEELYTLHKIDLIFMDAKLDVKFVKNIINEGKVFYVKG